MLYIEEGMMNNVTGMYGELGSTAELSSVVIVMLQRGVIYMQDNQGLWDSLQAIKASVSDYVAVLGLKLTVNEAEGYAFLSSLPEEEGQETIPRLFRRNQLSYRVSLLLALLRERYVEFDANGGENQLRIRRNEVVDMIEHLLPPTSDEVQLNKKIDIAVKELKKYGFIRILGDKSYGDYSDDNSKGAYTIVVLPIIKAFVDAQWLGCFEERMAEYLEQIDQLIEGENENG